MGKLVNWDDEVGAKKGKKTNTSGVVWAKTVVGETHIFRPVGKPIRFYRITNRRDGRLYSVIVDDPDDNTDEIEAGVNDAQTQRLENVANEAAWQESALQDAVLKDLDNSKDMDYYKGEIVDMRESGMGWGEIVHALNSAPYNLEIHNSVLGLGHSKISSEEAVQSSKHSSRQSGNNQGQGLALGHSKDNSSNRGSDHGGGNGGGKGGGNGGGKK